MFFLQFLWETVAHFRNVSVPSSRPTVQIPKAQQKEKRSCVGDLQFLVGSKYGKR